MRESSDKQEVPVTYNGKQIGTASFAPDGSTAILDLDGSLDLGQYDVGGMSAFINPDEGWIE